MSRGLFLGGILGTCGLGLSGGGVAIPNIAGALHTSESSVAWVVNCFALGLGVGTILIGRALDFMPARRVADACSAMMVVGVVGSAAAGTFATLLAARLVVGLGAGGLCSVAFVLGSRGVPADRRAPIAGLMTATSMSLIGAGPLLGASAMSIGGWRAAMVLPALSVLPTLAIRDGSTPSDEPASHTPFDAIGICLVTLVAASLTGTFQAPGTGAGLKLIALLGAVTVAGAAALVGHVRRRPQGFLPAALAGHKQFMLLNAGAMTLLASYSVMLYAGPSVLRANAGFGPVAIGLTLAPAAAVAAVAAHHAPRAIVRFRPTAIVVSLCGIATAGLLIASLGTDAPILILVATTLTVSAFSAGQATMQASTPTLVPADHVGAALGLFNFFFICGAAIGTSATAGSSAAVGLQRALLILSALPLTGAVLAYSAQRVAQRRPRSVR